MALLGLLALSACNAETTIAVSNAPTPKVESAPTDSIPEAVPTQDEAPKVVASPTVSPTPSPTPTVTPSPTPTPYAFPGGNGTIGSPYHLDTAADVQHIDEHSSAYFTVTQDIDMSGVVFTPLHAFSGVLYGNNHHFYHLVIAKTDGTTAALFASLSGTIVSLVIQSATISSNGYAAGFAGTLTGSALISSGSVSGTITSGLGGNGFNTGTGNGVYVTKSAGSTVTNVQQSVVFNGNTVNATL